MTQLSAPLPRSHPPLAAPVFRLTWRHCFYALVGGLWLVGGGSLFVAGGSGGAWLMWLVSFPSVLAIDVIASGRLLETAPFEATPTHAPCFHCGALWPKDELRWDDGLLCPECPAQPVSMELE